MIDLGVDYELPKLPGSTPRLSLGVDTTLTIGLYERTRGNYDHYTLDTQVVTSRYSCPGESNGRRQPTYDDRAVRRTIGNWVYRGIVTLDSGWNSTRYKLSIPVSVPVPRLSTT